MPEESWDVSVNGRGPVLAHAGEKGTRKTNHKIGRSKTFPGREPTKKGGVWGGALSCRPRALTGALDLFQSKGEEKRERRGKREGWAL